MSEMNVVSLHGHHISSREPDENCILVLEDLLAQARAGEIVGVCASVAHYDGCASKAIGGQVEGYSVLGALEDAKFALIALTRC